MEDKFLSQTKGMDYDWSKAVIASLLPLVNGKLGGGI